jgi:tRNA uridine 5-carbamoylmethylation protein Kti12
LIYLFYILIGASIIQEIESDKNEISSSIKNFQQERERLLIKIIEKRNILDLEQYTKHVYKHIRQYEEEIKKYRNFEENSSLNFSCSLFFISTTLTTIGKNYEINFSSNFCS